MEEGAEERPLDRHDEERDRPRQHEELGLEAPRREEEDADDCGEEGGVHLHTRGSEGHKTGGENLRKASIAGLQSHFISDANSGTSYRSTLRGLSWHCLMAYEFCPSPHTFPATLQLLRFVKWVRFPSNFETWVTYKSIQRSRRFAIHHPERNLHFRDALSPHLAPVFLRIFPRSL